MADLNKRCPTGIPGFDELIDGGLPRNRSILLSGTCGTGKTTFAAQFLYNGVVKYDEAGILVTLEQDAEEMRHDLLHYGLDLKKLENAGKLILIDTSLSKIGFKEVVTNIPGVPTKSFSLLPGEFDMEKITNLTIQAARNIGARRVVIDSLPALDVLMKTGWEVRKVLLHMNYEFKSNGLTTILVSEVGEEDGISRHGVEEYIADGVVILRTNEALDIRTIKIRKMRLTKHTLKPHTLEFVDQGIVVRTPEKKL